MTRYIFPTLLAGLVGCGLAAAAPAPELSPEDAQDLVFLAPARPIVIRLYVQIDGKPATQGLDAWIKDLFAYLDRDGDGKLNGEEAERAPKVQALMQRLQQGYGFFNGAYQTTPLGEIDENSDGKVTLEELTRYYRSSDLGTPRLTVAPGTGYSADALTDALFNHFDLNKDGKLTPEEMAKAAEVLARLDSNDDETVSSQELLPGVQAGFQQGFVGGGMGMMGQGARPTAFFLATGRLDLAQQILARYDTNKDGVLNRDEIELDDATFQRLDANGDLDLSGAELLKLIGKTADMEVVLRLGTVADKQPAVEVLNPDKANSLLKAKIVNGGLTVTFGTAQLDLRPAVTPSYGPQQMEAQKRQISFFFTQLDTAKRGFVDKQDVAKPQGRFLQNVFDVADRDGDGKLTEKEVAALLDLDMRAGTSCLLLAAGEGGGGLFELLDANRDGRLSLREMRSACERAGGDGPAVIVKAALPRQFSLAVSQGVFANFGRVVFPMNGRGGVVPPPAAGGSVGPMWFRKMDANGDGDVSRREWLGSREDFQRLDRDGDGVITPEEAARAEELQKK
jgi:Ca2+-binding EF-hand superfamily protein